MLVEELIKIMKTHERLIRDLELVQQLNLPNWCIAAGYVRNFVWDYLHEFPTQTPLNDVDVLYFDLDDLREETEKSHETILKNQLNEYNWSLKNQARMHIRNQENPYLSVADAMKRWPETVTAIGLCLNKEGGIEVIAPHGLNDLFDLVIRRSPYYKNSDYFYTRVQNKKWLEIWPQLRIIEDESFT
jgi:hypothetical protein